MATAAVIATKKVQLTTPYVTTYNQLTSSPVILATIASATNDTVVGATQKLSLLIDEGLAVQLRSPNNPNGATLSTYKLS